MYPFEIVRPSSVAAAVAALASTGGRALAGGQSLVGAMKLRLAQPGTLVDLSGVPGLAGIRRDGDAIVIGAMTRHADIAASAEVRAAIPALAALAGGIGDRQVRNMGTLGGSLANNDPAACWPAAVLGLDATVVTSTRRIAAADYFRGMYETALAADELIVAVELSGSEEGGVREVRQPRLALRAGRRVRRRRRPAGSASPSPARRARCSVRSVWRTHCRRAGPPTPRTASRSTRRA